MSSSLKGAEPKIQKIWLAKLRRSLLEKSQGFVMPHERKSYIYHQVSHIHELDELLSFIQEINQLQLAQCPENIDQDLIFISPSGTIETYKRIC